MKPTQKVELPHILIKKMFEPCEIRIDETERFETLEGKIISYSIPNEHYKNIGDDIRYIRL